jgi:hypothetical protein
LEAVIVTRDTVEGGGLRLERADIASLCHLPHSVAEISAALSLPIGVVRVLVAELASEGHLVVNLPLDQGPGQALDRGLLERVLAGLEAL